MIVFDLHCEHGHRFEGWFKSSSDYEDQKERGFVDCPECGSHAVSKAPMAPAVPAKSNTLPERGPQQAPQHAGPQAAPQAGSHSGSENAPQAVSRAMQSETPGEGQSVSNTEASPEVQRAVEALVKAQAKALENSTYVGKDFAKQSREMHYGERENEVIHGQASLEEAKALVEEGVQVAPLPFPVAPPDKLN